MFFANNNINDTGPRLGLVIWLALFGLLLSEGAALAAKASIGGRKMTCARGSVVFNDKMQAIGLASPALKKIWLNRKKLRRYPAAFQHYVFLHECAHQYMRSESDADCWAIKRGVYRRLFNRASIRQICRTVRTWPGSFWHPPGPARCRVMQRCLNEALAKRKRKRKRK